MNFTPLLSVVLLLVLFILSILCTTTKGIECPSYHIPIELDQNDPRLQDAYNQVDQLIQQEMDSNGIKSFVATIVYRDQMVWSKSYGRQNPLNDSSPLLTIDSYISVASITKVFTDLMMFQLRDRGLVQSLDDPLDHYIKEFSIINPYKQSRKITLRELSSHQSGVPRELPCSWLGTNCTEELILSMLSKMFLVLPQYSITHYSNLGVSLLGHALGRAASEPYHSYVRKNILEPLSMHNSTFSFQDALPTLAIGLTLLPNGTYIETAAPPVGWATPAGGLYSTGRDMSKFISFWLSSDDYNDLGLQQPPPPPPQSLSINSNYKEDKSKVLSQSTINEALSAINLVNDGVSAYGTPFEMLYDQKNQVWLQGKHGVHVGVRSQIMMAKQYKLGIFFSAMLSISSPDVFTQAAMDILLPVYQTILTEQQSPVESSRYSQQFKDPSKRINDEHKHDGDKSDPRSLFIGAYGVQNQTLLVIWVDKKSDQLVATGTSLPKFNVSKFLEEYPLVLRLELSQPSTFICKNVIDGPNYELMYFTLDNNISSTHCSTLLFMGQQLSFISNDIDYINQVIQDIEIENQQHRSTLTHSPFTFSFSSTSSSSSFSTNIIGDHSHNYNKQLTNIKINS